MPSVFCWPNVARLDADVREAIAANGIRNGCLTSIAPTGTISLLAANVSAASNRRSFRPPPRSQRHQASKSKTAATFTYQPPQRLVGSAQRCRMPSAKWPRPRRCPSTSPCGRRCSRSSTAPFQRRSIARKTSASRVFATFMLRLTTRAQRLHDVPAKRHGAVLSRETPRRRRRAVSQGRSFMPQRRQRPNPCRRKPAAASSHDETTRARRGTRRNYVQG